MPRNPGSTSTGGGFDISTVQMVWSKATPVPGYDDSKYRKDRCGAWITRTEYGNTNEYGWEIDHIQPASKGGGDGLGNLQPLQWRNNRGKGDDYPNWTCAISA